MDGDAEAGLDNRELARSVERALGRALRRERERQLSEQDRWARMLGWPVVTVAAVRAMCAALGELKVVGWLLALSVVVGLFLIACAVTVA
jgi:hypothetical protein